jgi:peroxiredoxin
MTSTRTTRDRSPLPLGSPAPDFLLPDQHGSDVSRDGLAGRAALIVFYPFAFTAICTSELGAIQSALDSFQNDDVQVVAVSCDPLYTLRAFADDQGFGFPLLSDFWPHGATAERYGVFDLARGCATRGSFLLDRHGILRWSVLNPISAPRDFDAHLEAVAALG